MLCEPMKAAALEQVLPCRSCYLGKVQPHESLLPSSNPFWLLQLAESNKKPEGSAPLSPPPLPQPCMPRAQSRAEKGREQAGLGVRHKQDNRNIGGPPEFWLRKPSGHQPPGQVPKPLLQSPLENQCLRS